MMPLAASKPQRLVSGRSTVGETALPVYQQLIEAIRHSSVVNADETGWRIGTLSALVVGLRQPRDHRLCCSG